MTEFIRPLGRTFLLVAMSCLAMSGCGSSGPAVAPVSGTVTFQGQPVQDAQVMFTPAGGRPAEGTTDASGKFQLSTFDANDGALVGEHRVTIVKMVKQDPNDPYSAVANALPVRYADATQTPLVQKVEAGGKRDLQFDLTDK